MPGVLHQHRLQGGVCVFEHTKQKRQKKPDETLINTHHRASSSKPLRHYGKPVSRRPFIIRLYCYCKHGHKDRTTAPLGIWKILKYSKSSHAHTWNFPCWGVIEFPSHYSSMNGWDKGTLLCLVNPNSRAVMNHRPFSQSEKQYFFLPGEHVENQAGSRSLRPGHHFIYYIICRSKCEFEVQRDTSCFPGLRCLF